MPRENERLSDISDPTNKAGLLYPIPEINNTGCAAKGKNGKLSLSLCKK
jgi:hypothetical protein